MYIFIKNPFNTSSVISYDYFLLLSVVESCFIVLAETVLCPWT